jgi:ABC-type enterochelin transport system permease subunit
MSAAPRYLAATIWDLYRAIWRVTGRQQILLISLSIAVAGLKFQQLVVNSLVEAATSIVSAGCAGAFLASRC